MICSYIAILVPIIMIIYLFACKWRNQKSEYSLPVFNKLNKGNNNYFSARKAFKNNKKYKKRKNSLSDIDEEESRLFE